MYVRDGVYVCVSACVYIHVSLIAGLSVYFFCLSVCMSRLGFRESGLSPLVSRPSVSSYQQNVINAFFPCTVGWKADVFFD